MHMAYLDQTRRPSPASMAGVIAIHAAVGVAIVTGLTVSGTIAPPDEIIGAFEIKDIPPPPPEPTPEPTTDTTEIRQVDPPMVIPRPPLDLPVPAPRFDSTDIILPPTPPLPTPGPTLGLDPVPTPRVTPTQPPVGPSVGAKPRNDPSAWISTDDYRSSWINREMTGTARFRLEIAANGRVTNCTITGSTGHSALDQATCQLLERRAKFQPARTGSGEPIAGSYESAVRWVLPD
ncbi:TonB family protein [Erythrobacter sp. A6_0]|nr:TonB family protein [Erythrobacter sp. A6_0]